MFGGGGVFPSILLETVKYAMFCVWRLLLPSKPCHDLEVEPSVAVDFSVEGTRAQAQVDGGGPVSTNPRQSRSCL